MKTLLTTTAIVFAASVSFADTLGNSNDYKTTINKSWTQTFLDNFTDRNVIKTLDHSSTVSVTGNGTRLESEISGSDDTFVSNEVYTTKGGAGLYAYDWAELEDGTEVENESSVNLTSTALTIEAESVTVNGSEVVTADTQTVVDYAQDLAIASVAGSVAGNTTLNTQQNGWIDTNASDISELEGDLDDTNYDVKANAKSIIETQIGVLTAVEILEKEIASVETYVGDTEDDIRSDIADDIASEVENLQGEIDSNYSDIVALQDEVAAIVVTNGTDGKDGINGVDGVDGAKGDKGDRGRRGQRGRRGIAGTNGIDGTDGVDGLNGVDGIDGIDGKDGRDGIDGVTTVVTKVDEATQETVASNTGRIENLEVFAEVVHVEDGEIHVGENSLVLTGHDSGIPDSHDSISSSGGNLIIGDKEVEGHKTTVIGDLHVSLNQLVGAQEDVTKAIADALAEGDYASVTQLGEEAQRLEGLIEDTHDRISQIRDASIYHDQRIEKKVDANTAAIQDNTAAIKRNSAAIAGVSAQVSGLSALGGQEGFYAGTANVNGSTAIALGVQKSLSDSVTVNFGAATDTYGSSVTVSAGIGWKF